MFTKDEIEFEYGDLISKITKLDRTEAAGILGINHNLYSDMKPEVLDDYILSYIDVMFRVAEKDNDYSKIYYVGKKLGLN